MPAEFFSRMELPTITPAGTGGKPQCGACGLYKGCNSPKMGFTGKGGKGIYILSESPGKEEDRLGKLLVGKSSIELKEALDNIGINLRKDCWLDNSLMCRPPGNSITDKSWIDYCRPHVVSTIQELKPKVILALGGTAIKSLGSWLWKPKDSNLGAIEPWVGESIPAQQINAWIVPTYHPVYLFKMKDQVIDRMFETHLKLVAKLANAGKRPWKKGELDSFNDGRALTDSNHGLAILRSFIHNGKPVAFDYETNRLKPHGPGARIRCVGLSDGQVSVAFELDSSKIRNAFKEFLRSDIPKIAHNAKFEDEWSKAVFGVWPKNNDNCTMITAHVLDGRENTTSLKFQSFVKFGMPDYDSHIKPYLQGKGSYGNNRVFDLPADKILTYCATDALLEYKLWEYQQRQINKETGRSRP